MLKTLLLLLLLISAKGLGVGSCFSGIAPSGLSPREDR